LAENSEIRIFLTKIFQQVSSFTMTSPWRTAASKRGPP